MLRFTDLDPQMPDKRPAAERREDFAEIYADFARDHAAKQASRCSQCGVPFCQIHCPLGNNIPDWLRATAEGRLEEAYALSQATNAMPEICGRICPQDRLCEGSCVIEQSGHGTVTIGAVERFLTETAWAKGWVKPVRVGADSGKRIAIIGTGPAGLTAAELLRTRGHAVTLYDRHDRAGGLLTYGIPNFKLEKHIVERRLARLREAGIQFKLETEVGSDVRLGTLRESHDAVLVTTGVYKPREVELPGLGLPGVVPALDYLITSNRKTFGDAVPPFDDGTHNAADKNVVVIGGGDTAMDCVRTAVRQGAKSVTCLYRRDRANMPGSLREVSHAEEEGVVFEWLGAPLAIEGKGKAERVIAQRMRLGAAGADGRQAIDPLPGSTRTLDADLVILALGFEPEDLPRLFHEPLLGTRRDGTLAVDPVHMTTSMPGVFAAGDIVRGASLVVWAIRDGREAARAMMRYVAANKLAEAS